MSLESPITIINDASAEAPSRANCNAEASPLNGLPKIVSLFCGAGGMDLGFSQAGYPLAVAIDAFPAAIESYRYNFPGTFAEIADLTALGPEGVLGIVRSKIAAGERIAVIGGPPCQGFSRANISSETDDPRNDLPRLYLEIVRSLQSEYVVEFLVIENVLGIKDKKHAKTYGSLVSGIAELNFEVIEEVLSAPDFGVAQTRNRVILIGTSSDQEYSTPSPRGNAEHRTVKDLIGSLAEPVYYARDLDSSRFPEHVNHWTMRPKSPRFIAGLMPSSKRRSFKCLDWHKPSPTIAFGNREIHVHPDGHRRISIFEAMLLQGFPKSFVLKGNLSEQVTQVSNAVPPPLAKGIASALINAKDGK